MSTADTLKKVELTRTQKVSIWCDQVVDAVNRSPKAMLLIIAAVYFAVTFSISAVRLFWFDELVTYYIAKLNNVHAIWHALYNGADPNPPLSHLAVMLSMRLFGAGQIAARLPGILIAFVGVWCLFEFLRKRVPVAYAAAGAFVFITTRAMDYSYETRSYAFLLGFAMLSLVMWRAAVEGRHRMWATVGLALTLAAGISSNFYGVLAFFPIAAGELVRNVRERKIEWRVWIAMAVAGPTLFPYLGMISNAVARYAPYAWNKPDPMFLSISYAWMLDIVYYPALALLWAGIVVYIYQRVKEHRREADVPPLHELVAVSMQMAYPFIGFAIAIARAGMIAPRLVLPLCYGVAITFAVTAYRLFSRSAAAALLILFACFSMALGRNSDTVVDILDQREALFNLREHLPKDRPLAVSDSLLSLPLYYYSAPDVRKRIIFPWDLDSIRKYKLEDSAEQNLNGGRGVFPVPLVPAAQLEEKYPDYVIVTTPDNWFLQHLMVDGVSVHRMPVDTGARHIAGFFPLCHSQPFLFTAHSTAGTTSVAGLAEGGVNHSVADHISK